MSEVSWKNVSIGEICATFSGGTPSRGIAHYFGGDIAWIKSGEVNNRFIHSTEETISQEGFQNSSAKFVEPETVLVAMYGATAGVVGMTKIKATINQAILALVPKRTIVDGLFLLNLLEHLMPRELRNLQGAQPNLNAEIVKDISLLLPPLPEQKKIAEILSTWDTAIATTEKLISAKRTRKRALMQRLLTGKQRFPQFAGQAWEKDFFDETITAPSTLNHNFGDLPQGWEMVSLGSILSERAEYSADLEKFPLYSFTIENGVTPKTDRYERSFLLKNQAENEYKLVHHKDFVLNPMNLRFGAIAYSKVEKTVSVSAYYDILYLKHSDFDIDFLEEFLTTPKMFHIYNRVATGSLIEKQRVYCSEFKKLKICLPPKEEQKKIGDVIRTVNKEIELLEKQLGAFKEQKRGLMQQLLTGKVRVKVDEQPEREAVAI